MTELLRADHLTRHFKIGGTLARGTLHAVDDVSFSIGEREIVALAGESGSGKSTVARLLARVYQPTSGTVTYFGDAGRAGRRCRRCRSRRDALRYSGQVPMVFQDPFSSLNPVFRVSHGVLRALKLHRPELSAGERRAEAARVFDVVGLGAGMLDRYPHELSGGQRQRVGFAQALATRPRLILADEPVSMLDTSIRIGLLNLMAKLRDEEGVSILYITHDIASATVRRGPADRDVRRADRGGRPDRGRARGAEAPLHAAAAFRGARPEGAAAQPGGPGRGDRRARRAAEGDRPQARLPVPAPLPGRGGDVRDGHPGAADAGHRARWHATSPSPARK